MNIQQSECFLCNYNAQSFQTLVPHSLYNKYSSSQNFYYTKDIDGIVHEEICSAYIQFQECNYLDEAQQFMKRQYLLSQYDKKITMLSQYYKFHRDLPVWNERSVEILMERYYSKVKDVDYKKIKKVLKQQQNISISTHKSFSSFEDSSEVSKRSRYSTMLNALNNTKNQSIVLMDLCDRIGKALKKVKGQPTIKGNFISNEKKFEDFLKRQERKKENYIKKAGKRNGIGLKRIKFNPKLCTKNDELQIGLKEIKFASNHSINNRRSKGKSIDKTTANETISREEKVKMRKDKQNFQINSGRSSISFQRKLTPSQSNRLLKKKNIIGLGNNENLKTINEIYKPTQNTEMQRKQSTKILSRLKGRSNSHHNLPTASSRNRENVKVDEKLTRVNSQRFPDSIAKRSIIELEKTNSNEKQVTKGRQSQKISRSNSLRKVGSTAKTEQTNGSGSKVRANNILVGRKTSVIENMLEKKLTIFKKKQPIL